MGEQGGASHRGAYWFGTTDWSGVFAAGRSGSPAAEVALEKLCCKYWYPLYAYVRRQGHSSDDAQDLTQAFFAWFLEKKVIQLANPARGKFRSFLLMSLRHFVANQWEKAHTIKRGGDQVRVSWDQVSAESRYQLDQVSDMTPERSFDTRWGLALFQHALERLSQEYVANGKASLFERLKSFLTEVPDEGAYASVATRLNITAGSVAVAVHRLRQRYGELV